MPQRTRADDFLAARRVERSEPPGGFEDPLRRVPMIRADAQALLNHVASLPLGQRRSYLARHLQQHPQCGLARYAAACELFDSGRPATGALHMMHAYKALPVLGSASLLAFTGLYLAGHPKFPLLDALTATWHEFRKPVFDVTPLEQRVFDVLTGPLEIAPNLDADHVRFARLPIEQIRSATHANPTVSSSNGHGLNAG